MPRQRGAQRLQVFIQQEIRHAATPSPARTSSVTDNMLLQR